MQIQEAENWEALGGKEFARCHLESLPRRARMIWCYIAAEKMQVWRARSLPGTQFSENQQNCFTAIANAIRHGLSCAPNRVCSSCLAFSFKMSYFGAKLESP